MSILSAPFRPGSMLFSGIALLIASCSGGGSATIGIPDPGFDEAYFDKDDLSVLAGDEPAPVFHFYNVIPEAGTTEGSVVAMAADKDHDEVYSLIKGPWYRCYTALEGSQVTCARLTKDEALEHVEQVRLAGLTTFASVFTHDEVMGMFEVAECNAVRLRPERTADGRYWTMRMTPVKIADGVATVVGTESDERTSTNPCPTYCGTNPAYFLHCR